MITSFARFAAFGVAACSAGTAARSETSTAEGEACRFVLAPRKAPPERLPPANSPLGIGSSRIVAHAEVALARIKNELEAKVDRRLADVRGASIGIAGIVNYTADRGPFSLSVERDALVVRTDVRAHAEACSRGSCYASCDPTAVARAEVPLKLGPGYRFAPSRVTASFTRGCKIRALGGFLTIDLTKTLENELASTLRRVQNDIDRQLPDFKPEAERIWTELSKARKVPLVGCVVVQPRGLVQGPVTGTRDALHLRFALRAAPELRTHCDEPPALRPLPPLEQDPTLPAEDEVMLGLVSPLSSVASAFEAVDRVDVGGARARVERAAVVSAGAAIDADLSLLGEVCGDVALRASPAWSRDGRALELGSVKLAPGEKRRIAAASLEPGSIASAVGKAPRIGLLLDVERIDDVLPALAQSLSDESVDVSATVTRVRPAAAIAREEALVAWLAIRGRLVLKQK